MYGTTFRALILAAWGLPVILGFGVPSVAHAQAGQEFHRGDANGDGNFDLSDAVYTFGFLFLGGAAPKCDDATDANDDGAIDISDGISMLSFLFTGGAPPAAPGPTTCGVDPTADNLGCADYPVCGAPPTEEISWSFEADDLEGWEKLDVRETAFDSQPTWGNNVSTRRAMQVDDDFMALLGDIGGDYWNGPYPIGIDGFRWIGTYENRPQSSDPWGRRQGDAPTGTLISPPFALDKRYIHFLIGGGCDVDTVGIELQVRNGRTWVSVPASRRTGMCDERLRRVTVDLRRIDFGLPLPPQSGRLAIYDLARRGWGHINVDDIHVSDSRPEKDVFPVWGFADTHAHLTAKLGFDALLLSGNVGDLAADGTVSNTGRCTGQAHSQNAGLSSAHAIYKMSDQHLFGRSAPTNLDTPNHDRVGPFNSRWSSLTHQQMYEKWVYRAYKGGLRLLVTEAVNSRGLSWILSGTHPDVGPERDSTSYLAQIRQAKAIAARNDWMEIALSPADARRIIRDGHLAVILGIEVDSFGNCDLATLPTNDGDYYHAGTSRCTDMGQVMTALDEAYDLGVRQLHPIHLTDNAFGGAALYNDEFNSSNHYLNNRFFDVDSGTLSQVDWSLKREPDVATVVRFGTVIISKTLGSYGSNVYGTGLGHVNRRGLTNLGRGLIREMMKRGMIIAADHMSEKGLDELLGLVNPTEGRFLGTPLLADASNTDLSTTEGQALAYPVALTHSSARQLQFSRSEAVQKSKWRSEGGKRVQQIRRIGLIGGIAVPGFAPPDVKTSPGRVDVDNNCAGTSASFGQYYNYYYAKRAGRLHGVHYGMPIGTDFNGVNGSANPRYGMWGCWKKNQHIGDLNLTVAISSPNGGGEGNDWVQRKSQLDDEVGVRYDFYNAGEDATIPHSARLGQNWLTRSNGQMGVTTGQPALKAAKKDEDGDDWNDHWDINFDGVAHYGMLPDYFQDMRAVGFTREDMGPLMLGAEAYIRMWEKAWSQKNSR